MKKLWFVLLLLLSAAAHAQYVSLNDNEINNLHDLINKNADVKKLYNAYISTADEAVNIEPTPIDFIRTEGLLQGDTKKAATTNSLRDMRRMYALALGYRMENEKSYLQNLSSYFSAWAKVNKGLGDPIDDTNLEQVIEAYDLVKTKLKPNVNDAVIAWFKQTADAEIASHQKAIGKETSYNNWNSHRLKIVGMIAYAIDDAGYKKYVSDDLQTQLEKNLLPDGSSIDFKLRDALHYHVYDLEPLLRLAIVLKRATGVDVYSTSAKSGASIKKSVEWLIPYVSGEKKHGEFVNSTVAFDQARAKNGEAEYKAGSVWDAQKGLKTLALAAYFDPQYNVLIKKVKPTASDYSEWQLVINKVSQ